MQLNDEESSQPEVKKEQVEQKETEQASSEAEILIHPSTGSASSESKEKSSAFFKRFWEWSGFGKKTLFEILQFLAILTPIVIFFAGQQASDRVRQETDEKEAVLREKANYQQVFSNYLSLMRELLLNRDIRQDKVNSIAKVETLTTLRYLEIYDTLSSDYAISSNQKLIGLGYSNAQRKGELIRFLYATKLIGGGCRTNLNTGKATKCLSSILDLSGASLDGLIFDSPVVLTGIDLSKVSMIEASFEKSDLTSAKMNGANLSRATLSRATLSEAQMESSVLQESKLVEVLLDKANLSNSHLNGADLSGANLQNTNLSGADLRGANFKSADLKSSKFHGATYSSKTLFPEGFDPVREGMINER